MRLPDGIRKSANVLLCLTAVAGIGLSGQEIWRNLHARWQIDAGCGGLVPAGRVLALDRAGGKITHRRGESETIEVERLASGPEQCGLVSAEAGGRWFFTGAVGVYPSAAVREADSPSLPPLDQFGPLNYAPQPLGGGITGFVDDTGVRVELPCTGGKVVGKPVTALWAHARLEPPSFFAEWGQPGAGDRDVLAETAVVTANRLAERLGCDERLPDPPSGIPALPEGPVPADRAGGTCAWYRESGLAGRDHLPDTVLEGGIDDNLMDERCVLVMSRGAALDTHGALWDELDPVGPPNQPGQWFVTLHTYLGDAARKVIVPGGAGEDDVHARPGTAGRAPGDSVWWASSDCGGRPQLHTMTIDFGYVRAMISEAEDLLRTYAAEVADRRTCTDLTLPEPASFTVD
ncbi:hypothetical protein AB0D49_33895 [Streptomyces sp. NPDC048290]|uniref:hypothetical protein n=1 Tax=Streptomyces sp. NPDC048290 TaxID=3155811 RepID=UPI00342CD25C